LLTLVIQTQAHNVKMKTATILLAAAGLVAGHGYVDNATIGGQYYQVSFRKFCVPVIIPY